MQKRQKIYKIAIDGGAGTGKSVTAKELARRLNIVHIDSGAMYRAAAYYFLNNNIEINEENAEKYIEALDIDIKYIDNMNVILLNGENITNKIRTEAVSDGASRISTIPIVRKKLVDLQQELGEKNSVVMDGRDIGSVVFPDAVVKVYFETDITERARRRQKDLQKHDEFLSIEEIKKDLEERDFRDMNRKTSPLKKVDDAITINTTNLTVLEVVDEIIKILVKKKVI